MGTHLAHVRQHASEATVSFAGLVVDALEVYGSHSDIPRQSHANIYRRNHNGGRCYRNRMAWVCSLSCIPLRSGVATRCYTFAYVLTSYRTDQYVPQRKADNKNVQGGVTTYTMSISLLSICMDYTDEEVDTWLDAALGFLRLSTHSKPNSPPRCRGPNMLAALHHVIQPTVPSSRYTRDLSYRAHVLKRITQEGKLDRYGCSNFETAEWKGNALHRYYGTLMVATSGHLERGSYAEPTQACQTIARNAHQLMVKRQVELPGL